MKRLLSTVFFSVLTTCCMVACGSQETDATDAADKTTGQNEPTAKEWNQGVVGWNLGNQFECSAPGQDGESTQIGNPDGSIRYASPVS